MKKEYIKAIFSKQKFQIILIILLLLSIGFTFVQKQDYKHTTFYQYQAIPDIELKNTLYQTQGGLSGEVRGFVKFDNMADQPIGMRQYYIIKSSEYFDNSESQYFSLEEIIKTQYLSPKSLGNSLLREVSDTDRTITLEDENGNQFFIDKNTYEISMRDITGNNTSLITSDTKYSDFMKQWLLKK